MEQKNDERIMQLKETIRKKRDELKKYPQRFNPITNCLLVLDKVTYNLHVDASVSLLIKLNMMAMSAEDLGIDITKYEISGYSLSDWIADVNNYLEIQEYKAEKRKLDSLESQLTALLSDDKRTELQIDSLAALLN